MNGWTTLAIIALVYGLPALSSWYGDRMHYEPRSKPRSKR